ncbi:MAG TPA: STAS domain-containing protein [Acidobacteriota bacterium]|nr:STAS domain-containing protein [Acidobacteriota bacterium]
MGHSTSPAITARPSGDVIVFDIMGDLSRLTPTVPTLSELVKDQLIVGQSRILLNLERTGFVDSWGVGELLATYISIRNRNGALKLCAIPDRLAALFRITQIDKVLAILPTEKAALEAFAQPPETKPKV